MVRKGRHEPEKQIPVDVIHIPGMLRCKRLIYQFPDFFRGNRFGFHTVHNVLKVGRIGGSVESKSVPPEKIGELVLKSLTAKHPRYVYNINRNLLLRLMSALPDHLQIWILKWILK